MKTTITTIIGSLAFASIAFAGGIQGSCVNKDGSKVDGTATISTSWNSKKSFPKKGFYTLDLGKSAEGETVTVYCDGKKVGTVKIPKGGGNARLDIVRR